MYALLGLAVASLVATVHADGCVDCTRDQAGNCYHAGWPGKSDDKCSSEKSQARCESNDGGVWCPTPPPVACPAGYNNASWTTYTSYACCCPNNPNYDPNRHDEASLQAFLVTAEPLLDKYAALLHRGDELIHNRKRDRATPLGHHHPRGITLPFAAFQNDIN